MDSLLSLCMTIIIIMMMFKKRKIKKWISHLKPNELSDKIRQTDRARAERQREEGQKGEIEQKIN